MDKLIKGAKIRETTGGFNWVTISKHLDETGWPINTNMLEEAWDSEEIALHAAAIRVEQGYRVNVFKYVALSVNSE